MHKIANLQSVLIVVNMYNVRLKPECQCRGPAEHAVSLFFQQQPRAIGLLCALDFPLKILSQTFCSWDHYTTTSKASKEE
jgi:hypothetical protein